MHVLIRNGKNWNIQPKETEMYLTEIVKHHIKVTLYFFKYTHLPKCILHRRKQIYIRAIPVLFQGDFQMRSLF